MLVKMLLSRLATRPTFSYQLNGIRSAWLVFIPTGLRDDAHSINCVLIFFFLLQMKLLYISRCFAGSMRLCICSIARIHNIYIYYDLVSGIFLHNKYNRICFLKHIFTIVNTKKREKKKKKTKITKQRKTNHETDRASMRSVKGRVDGKMI